MHEIFIDNSMNRDNLTWSSTDNSLPVKKNIEYDSDEMHGMYIILNYQNKIDMHSSSPFIICLSSDGSNIDIISKQKQVSLDELKNITYVEDVSNNRIIFLIRLYKLDEYDIEAFSLYTEINSLSTTQVTVACVISLFKETNMKFLNLAKFQKIENKITGKDYSFMNITNKNDVGLHVLTIFRLKQSSKWVSYKFNSYLTGSYFEPRFFKLIRELQIFFQSLSTNKLKTNQDSNHTDDKNSIESNICSSWSNERIYCKFENMSFNSTITTMNDLYIDDIEYFIRNKELWKQKVVRSKPNIYNMGISSTTLKALYKNNKTQKSMDSSSESSDDSDNKIIVNNLPYYNNVVAVRYSKCIYNKGTYSKSLKRYINKNNETNKRDSIEENPDSNANSKRKSNTREDRVSIQNKNSLSNNYNSLMDSERYDKSVNFKIHSFKNKPKKNKQSVHEYLNLESAHLKKLSIVPNNKSIFNNDIELTNWINNLSLSQNENNKSNLQYKKI